MAKVWKILALLLVITALVWLTTLWRWQSSQHDPGTSDLVLNLALLPLALTAGLVLAVWGVSKLRHYATSPAAPAAAAAPAASQAPASTGAAERSAHFRVLGSAVKVRAGSNWSEAHTRIDSGECKPELDPELKDDHGVAVFTAPVADLDTADVADELATLREGLAAAQPDARAREDVPADVARGLALLREALSAVEEPLAVQWPVLGALPPRNRPDAPAALPPTVSIRVAIPARWSAASQQLAGAWIGELLSPLVDAGLRAAGQSRAMANSARPAVQWHLHPVANADAFWLLMEQQLVQWTRDKEAGLLLAVAADSFVSDAQLAAMEARGELFSGFNQRGRVPGEGAAALLLASPAWTSPAEAEPPEAHLHRASMALRDKSADATGRIGSQTLQQATADALQGSGWTAAKVEALASDADHRSSRTGEVYETLQELLPHIDPATQALRLGAGCGDLGIARLLAGAALAAGQVKASEAAVMLLGTFPALERFAVLLTSPAAAPPALPAEAAKAG